MSGEPSPGKADRQRPGQAGSRFSREALRASTRSSLANVRAKASTSARQPPGVSPLDRQGRRPLGLPERHGAFPGQLRGQLADRGREGPGSEGLDRESSLAENATGPVVGGDAGCVGDDQYSGARSKWWIASMKRTVRLADRMTTEFVIAPPFM